MTSASDTPVRMIRIPASLIDLANLAGVLERIDRSSVAPAPAQYRRLVDRIIVELEQREADPALKSVLGCFPSTAELYENMHYEVAGLCMNSLERSVDSEQAARHILRSFAIRPASSTDG